MYETIEQLRDERDANGWCAAEALLAGDLDAARWHAERCVAAVAELDRLVPHRQAGVGATSPLAHPGP